MKIIARFVLCFASMFTVSVQAQNYSKMSVEQLQSAKDSIKVLLNYTITQEYAKYAKENGVLISLTFLDRKTIDNYVKNSPELQKAKLVYESVSEDLHALLMKDAKYNARFTQRNKRGNFTTIEDETNQNVKAIAEVDPAVNRLWLGKHQLLVIYHSAFVAAVAADYLKNKRIFSIDWIPEEGLSEVNSKQSIRLLKRKLLMIDRLLSKKE